MAEKRRREWTAHEIRDIGIHAFGDHASRKNAYSSDPDTAWKLVSGKPHEKNRIREELIRGLAYLKSQRLEKSDPQVNWLTAEEEVDFILRHLDIK